jgi:hypothetical protein
VYAPARDGSGYEPFAVKVITVQGGLFGAITGFVNPGLFARSGLPPRLPVDASPVVSEPIAHVRYRRPAPTLW